MEKRLSLIGFGEAGRGFAAAAGWGRSAFVYDRLTDDEQTRPPMEAAFRQFGVEGCRRPAEALASSPLVLSLVTADQALAAAESCSQSITAGSLFCDLNSVAPTTKQQAATLVEAAGASYVDVAVMAPVKPALLDVPLLLSGSAAEAAREALAGLGFTNARVVGARIGEASAIKMIRSVIVKGLEALTAEAMLAADAAGVTDEVIRSLDGSEVRQGWADRAAYNLGRMAVHGRRRADELVEVSLALNDLGVEPIMSRAAEQWQRSLGAAGIDPSARSLDAILEHIRTKRSEAA